MTHSVEQLKELVERTWADPEIEEGMLQDTPYFDDGADIEFGSEMSALLLPEGQIEPVYAGRADELMIAINNQSARLSIRLLEPEQLSASSRDILTEGGIFRGAVIVRDMDEGYPDTFFLYDVSLIAAKAADDIGMRLAGEINASAREDSGRYGFAMTFPEED